MTTPPPASPLQWAPATCSTDKAPAFTASPHRDFKADMAYQPETGMTLLVVNCGVPSVASNPEHRQEYANALDARDQAETLYADWQYAYRRDPSPSVVEPPAAPVVPQVTPPVPQNALLGMLNRKPVADMVSPAPAKPTEEVTENGTD